MAGVTIEDRLLHIHEKIAGSLPRNPHNFLTLRIKELAYDREPECF